MDESAVGPTRSSERKPQQWPLCAISAMQLSQWLNSSVPPSREKHPNSLQGRRAVLGLCRWALVLSSISLRQAVAPSVDPNLLCVWTLIWDRRCTAAASRTDRALALIPPIMSLHGAFYLWHHCWCLCRARLQPAEEQMTETSSGAKIKSNICIQVTIMPLMRWTQNILRGHLGTPLVFVHILRVVWRYRWACWCFPALEQSVSGLISSGCRSSTWQLPTPQVNWALPPCLSFQQQHLLHGDMCTNLSSC